MSDVFPVGNGTLHLEKVESSKKTRLCIDRLKNYDSEKPDLSSQPLSKLAAVLVLLYEVSGQLRVLLTTRSKHLRAHPGQTALPGGKVDESDGTIEDAAYREAYEEVGLPLGCSHVHTLCTLRPFLSASQLLVTPVVAWLSDLTVLDNLKLSVAEVDHIFDHPLEALLDPALAKTEHLVPQGSEHWLYETLFHNTTDIQLEAFDNAWYRMHRFRTSASPIKGLTAEILTTTAEIAYGRPAVYERYPSGHETTMWHLVCTRIDQNMQGATSPMENTITGPASSTQRHILSSNGQQNVSNSIFERGSSPEE